ncbi:MAG: ATP-binding protein [Nitrospirota bacterium]
MSARFPYRPSIRKKITFGYYAIVGAIIGLSLFTFMELRFIEKKIMSGEAVTEFFNTALEIRRFEKNYFLYGQDSDYRETTAYVSAARKLLEGNTKAFATVASEHQIARLRDGLVLYERLMEQYAVLGRQSGAEAEILEGRIRTAGKDIITIAESLAKTERSLIQALLYNSQSLLVFSILVLAFVGIAIGQVLSRIVVRPLKQLQDSMEGIADGKFETILIKSKDREIVSLTRAFNKMLKELELRQRHLLQSEKLASLGTLLSGVAHELNNPLSNISTSCQILTEEIGEDDLAYKKELLSQIDEQTDRARNIVRSLLDFSRDREFKKERLPLKKLFEETIRFIKGQVPTRVGVTLDIPDDLVIFADKQRMQQALLNLIRNAIEAVPGEGGISVRARQQRAVDKAEDTGAEIYNYLKYHGKCTLEEDTVDIEIRDTGVGIPREALPKIFDPFFTTKEVGKGSGLGLYIVHEIIDEHDGCIAADSEDGKGTTFIIRLPMPRELQGGAETREGKSAYGDQR